MAGNSIATDRGFIARDMAELDAHVHYRMVDVSSIKELARRWYPKAYFQAPEKHGGHRALADIQESIEELKYYRKAVFVPAPGPGHRHGEGDRRRVHPVRRFGRRLADSVHSSSRRCGHGGCSSAGRAPGCGPGGRGFKSRHSPHASKSR